MILKAAEVRKFRSIENSGTVRFDPDVTCLVGKNESGKTAFLEALHQANPSGGPGRGFDELRDYPRRLRGRDRAQIATTTPVEATFELSDGDLEAVAARFGDVLTSKELTVRRTYAGDRRVLVGDDEVQGDLAELLASRLPRFLYFDGYSVLPGRVSIPRLQATAEEDLLPGERTALALLRLAGVAADEFVESEYEVRKAALESAATTVSEEVFRYWSQNPELTVELDLDFRDAGGNGQGGPPFLDVRIRNHRHRVTTNFGERSGGLVWFFSFVAAFSELRESEGLVLLLDEPGLGLHAAGQADLLRYVNEQLTGGHQVVYTTHSPFMVDATRPHRARTVEDVEGEGTQVREGAAAASRDTVLPLSGALAVSLLEGLGAGRRTLLVGGVADLVYLEVMSGYLRDGGRRALDPAWRLLPTGGLAGLPLLAALLGGPLEAPVLLEVGAGHPSVRALIEQGLVLPERLLALTELTGQSEAGLEDLFDEPFYLHLLAATGTDGFDPEELAGEGSLVRRVERATGTALDRYRPASYLLQHQQRLLPAIGREPLHRFARLFATLDEL
ncbi:MAG TPA: AAA family ATPase [Actinomycetes bacterium]|nr:AAA family ATPase [Actinomycetes bacterium]